MPIGWCATTPAIDICPWLAVHSSSAPCLDNVRGSRYIGPPTQENPVANHASAKKRIRQTRRRTARNRHVRSTTRTAVKRVRSALANEDVQAAEQHLAVARKLIDRAVRKGVYHWKTGARYVSRLASQVDALKS